MRPPAALFFGRCRLTFRPKRQFRILRCQLAGIESLGITKIVHAVLVEIYLKPAAFAAQHLPRAEAAMGHRKRLFPVFSIGASYLEKFISSKIAQKNHPG